EVYVDSDNEYGQIFSTLGSQNGPWHAAAQAFAKPGADQLRLANFTGQTRSDLVHLGDDAGLEGASLATAAGVQPIQKIVAADGSRRFVAPLAGLAPLGWSAGQVLVGCGANHSSPLSVSATHLEHELLRVTFDKAGEITSVNDKTRSRVTLEPGRTT